jgi:hypothetical protein
MRYGHLMTLRRHDGAVYLKRWGISTQLFGVYLHRMDAPDPGFDLHDHPWAFASIVLAGGYTEERAATRDAPVYAGYCERFATVKRGYEVRRRRFTVKVLRLDECHRVTALDGATCWTLVVRGPARRRWGFYLPAGYMDERTYDATVRARRRDLWNEEATV